MENIKSGTEDNSNNANEKNENITTSHPSGPYPIQVKPTLSPKLTSKLLSAKDRFSALRASLRQDIHGIRSSIRKSTKLKKSKSHEHIKIEFGGEPSSTRHNEMPNKKSKSKSKNKQESTGEPPQQQQQQQPKMKNKAASLVRRLSIGKHKTMPLQTKEFVDDKSESSTTSAASAASSQQTPTSVKRHTPEGDDCRTHQLTPELMNITTNMDDKMSSASTDATVPPVPSVPSVPPIEREKVAPASSDTVPSAISGGDDKKTVVAETLDDYLDNIAQADKLTPPIQVSIVATENKDIETSDKTESCDEDEDTTEDHISEPTTYVSAADTNPGKMTPYGDIIAAEGGDRASTISSPSSMVDAGNERREHLYKILVIGELGTGKTSIIKRYVHQFFSQHYRATIGVDFALKVLNWDANTIIRLQLWDIAGQERFGNMTRVYYKEAVGAFIVFDVTRVATFDAVVKWKQDLDSKVQLSDGSPIPCILLANKCDQQKEGLVNQPAKMDEYCKEKGFAGWFETSAKENINIEEAARCLVNKILINDKLLHGNDSKKDNEIFALDGKTANGAEKSTSTGRTCSC